MSALLTSQPRPMAGAAWRECEATGFAAAEQLLDRLEREGVRERELSLRDGHLVVRWRGPSLEAKALLG